MATDADTRATDALTGAQPDKPVFRGAADETADRAIMGGAPIDHSLGDHVAAVTETPLEKKIDAANGLRGASGRTPTEEDFAGLLTPEGSSGSVAGSEVADSAFVFGEDGSLGGI